MLISTPSKAYHFSPSTQSKNWLPWSSTITASRICLLSTKAFWFFPITSPMTLDILVVNTLKINLYKLPTRLISLKSLIFLAPTTLGMSTKNVEFKDRTKAHVL